MSWKIVERKIGKAGNLKQRQKRQSTWDQKYGDNWMIGYVIEGEFISQEDALESIYYQSYAAHFEENPKDLKELIHTAKTLKNTSRRSNRWRRFASPCYFELSGKK